MDSLAASSRLSQSFESTGRICLASRGVNAPKITADSRHSRPTKRRLSNVDGWEAVVSDGIGAIKIALDSVFVLLVDSPSLVSERIDNVTS
jgi:hypothetical protein